MTPIYIGQIQCEISSNSRSRSSIGHFQETLSPDIMAPGYGESNVSLAFDANLASGFTTPGVTTPGYEEVDSPFAPMVQPMEVGEDGVEGRELPRADGGKDAWLVLVGCFTLEALVWGSVVPSDLVTGCRD
jgi:hypothetical protein